MKQFWITHKKWITYVKIALAFFTVAFILYKLLIAYKIDEQVAVFQFDFSFQNTVFLVFAVLLLFINWGLETLKWQLLIQQFEEIKFLDALKAVFSGVTLSIITPNQIGDFAGRVIHLKILNKIKGSLVTVIGHTAQSLVTAVFGMYALLAFAAKSRFLCLYLLEIHCASFFSNARCGNFWFHSY